MATAALVAVGDAILALANPNTDKPTRVKATAGLPILDFQTVLLIAAAYLAMVAWGAIIKPAGPPAKEERKKKSVSEKFRDEPVLYLQFVYNWVQVALCGYMMVTAAGVAFDRGYSLLCNRYDNTPRDKELLNVLWLFYASKILDFADTAFMIARGNWGQFTFLHTYHHTSIFLVYWVITSNAYDGDIYYTIVANSFIHFIMYGYYALTTVNVPIRNFGWIVTNAQLIQFVTMMFQALVILFYPGCNQYPRNMTIFYLVYILSLFLLFSNFKGKRFAKSPAAAAKEA